VVDSSSDTTYTATSVVDNEDGTITITITVDAVPYVRTIPCSAFTDNNDGTVTVTSASKIISDAGTASHPGDIGMALIADEIIQVIDVE
jgi:hypothetical protein